MAEPKPDNKEAFEPADTPVAGTANEGPAAATESEETTPESTQPLVAAEEPQETAPPQSTFQIDEHESSAPTPPNTEDTITWTASEFIDHNKSAGWYVAVLLVAAVLAAAIFLLTHDYFSTAVIVIVGIALASYGARKPRRLKYTLDYNGLLIADKHYSFDNFRSFAVQDEGALSSIVFVPLKRFGQLVTLYIDPEDENRIVNLLADYLPLENRKPDLLDQFMKRIRF